MIKFTLQPRFHECENEFGTLKVVPYYCKSSIYCISCVLLLFIVVIKYCDVLSIILNMLIMFNI